MDEEEYVSPEETEFYPIDPVTRPIGIHSITEDSEWY